MRTGVRCTLPAIKALVQATFLRLETSWNLFPNQAITIISWMDTVSSQYRALLESLWNALLPGHLPETSTTRRYSLQIRGGSDQKNPHEKLQLHLHMTYMKDFRGKNKQWLWQSVLRTHTTQSISSYDGPAHVIWSQPKADLVDCRSTPGKNSGYATWKLELCSSAHNGPTTRITCSHWSFTMYIYISSKVFTLVDDRLIYKTSMTMDSQQGAKAEQQLNTYPRGAKILALWGERCGKRKYSTIFLERTKRGHLSIRQTLELF